MKNGRRASLAFTKLAIGVDWNGGGLNLVALGLRFRRFLVIDELRLAEPLAPDSAARVSQFLLRNRLREARVIACLPRDAALVRFLDLPAEVESKLAQVVSYQLSSLHPFEDGQAAWDCAVTGRNPEKKQIRVMVVLAEKSRLQGYKLSLQELGLRVSGFTLAAAAVAPLLKGVLPDAALVIGARNAGVELMSFQRGRLCATQEVSPLPDGSAREGFEREVHGALAALEAPDPAAIPWFVFGSVPPAFAEAVERTSELPALKLKLASSLSGFNPAFQLPALAAAYSALVRKAAPSINLLPPDERWQPQRTARAPAYALGSVALLLALTLAVHGWIGRILYGRALDREIQRVSAPADRIRDQAQQTVNLAAKADVLESVRAGNWQKLRLLQELTRLVPNGTWLQDLTLTGDSVEIYGYSNRAADLVPPLENSPYFSQVEFTSPITRDNQNHEIFRMRMRLKQPARP